jgi:hypothetical integral membrane protein (TIGR02206 family)
MTMQPPRFAAFGWLHWTMLAAIAVAAILWVRWARAEPDEARRRHVEQMIAYANIALFIVIRLYLITPSQFKWSVWPPLGMCDIVSLLASIKLLNPRVRWLSIAVYFGGVGLCTNALITPDLSEGPRAFEFWAFWLRHAAIMVVAVYDLAVLRFRPDWSDWRRACALGLLYIAAVSAINVPLGFNFGFMGDSLPGHPSALDFLGPWPLRLVWVVVVVGSLWAAMTLPWVLGRRPSLEPVSPGERG